MKVYVAVLVLSSIQSIVAQFPNGRKLEPPIPELCAQRIIHETSPFGQNYFYQWRGKRCYFVESSLYNRVFFLENLDKEDWLGARNFCRMRCMDTVSFETPQENEWIKNTIAKANISEIWTSGRICDFKVRKYNHFLSVFQYAE